MFGYRVTGLEDYFRFASYPSRVDAKPEITSHKPTFRYLSKQFFTCVGQASALRASGTCIGAIKLLARRYANKCPRGGARRSGAPETHPLASLHSQPDAEAVLSHSRRSAAVIG